MSPSIRLSVIVPTCGRRTLARAVASALTQLSHEDEVIVVGDGPQPAAQAFCRTISPVVQYVEGPMTRCWGNTQRQVGLRCAVGDYVAFLDDDDIFVPGALPVMKAAVAESPSQPVLFQFVDRHGAVIWCDREVRQGNVSTQCVCVPNVTEKLGTWGERYEGDYDFITSTLACYGAGSVVWRPNIVQVQR